MRASISAPFIDTNADDLVWTLEHPLVDPLATRTVQVSGVTVELRVLGASHQVVLGAGTGALVETVACLPGVPGGLPGNAEHPLPGVGDYRFDSVVESLSRTDLARRVEGIQQETSDSPGGLIVAFPGDPLAVTALHLTSGSGVSLFWRTWHAYPQSGELVTTTTTLTP
ncbi:DUF2617 family protein [Nocardiopsis sp. MG754419]|uniref:DUF2617 family protein n=1 Tax=Nocardiopsis sp. MG754419 TaxID=2259865 RepID=UPI001BA59568|nr:DUF2617 family protein [Nocardiopsis sp. MG754419]MBR8744321.1 DUF2617 domain-containing protein [Nocardiopsis sp. MG754419]